MFHLQKCVVKRKRAFLRRVFQAPLLMGRGDADSAHGANLWQGSDSKKAENRSVSNAGSRPLSSKILRVETYGLIIRESGPVRSSDRSTFNPRIRINMAWSVL